MEEERREGTCEGRRKEAKEGGREGSRQAGGGPQWSCPRRLHCPGTCRDSASCSGVTDPCEGPRVMVGICTASVEITEGSLMAVA